jgi:flagellar motor switch protein FliM
LRLGADADGGCIVCIPRPLHLALIASSLGEPITKVLTDRPLTPIEQQVGQLLVRLLLSVPLQEAWPLPAPLAIDFIERGQPKKICPLRTRDIALAVALELEGPFGVQTISLLLPRFGPLRQLVGTDAATVPSDRLHMESLVRDMPTQISVVLGRAEVPLSRLATLAAGDLLVLDQRVGDPLTASVEATDKFRVWPGLIRRRQAVCIGSLVEN